MAENIRVPPSRQSTKAEEDDALWRDKMQEHRAELTNGLKRISVNVLKKLHVTKLINDKEFHSLKNYKPANIVEGILKIIESKTKREYLIFRDVLKDCRQLALYKLLDIENVVKANEVQGGGELSQLRKQVLETNHKMDDVLTAIKRMETKHDTQIQEIKHILQQKENECKNLRQENARLKAEIKSLKEKVKQGKSSKNLEKDLKSKQEELDKKEQTKIEMEAEIAKLKIQLHEKQRDVEDRDDTITKQTQEIHHLKAEFSSDVLDSKKK